MLQAVSLASASSLAARREGSSLPQASSRQCADRRHTSGQGSMSLTEQRVERIAAAGLVRLDADEFSDCPWCGANLKDEKCSANCESSRRVDRVDYEG